MGCASRPSPAHLTGQWWVPVRVWPGILKVTPEPDKILVLPPGHSRGAGAPNCTRTQPPLATHTSH